MNTSVFCHVEYWFDVAVRISFMFGVEMDGTTIEI